MPGTGEEILLLLDNCISMLILQYRGINIYSRYFEMSFLSVFMQLNVVFFDLRFRWHVQVGFLRKCFGQSMTHSFKYIIPSVNIKKTLFPLFPVYIGYNQLFVFNRTIGYKLVQPAEIVLRRLLNDKWRFFIARPTKNSKP